MTSITEKASALFSTGHNCAQSSYAALRASSGGEELTALKIAACFGGGICRTQGICGAVSGALMAIGEALWDEADPATSKERCAKMGRGFMASFEARYGSTSCRELTGCDFSTPEGSKAFADRGLHTTLCDGLVRGACEFAENVIKGARV